MAPHPGDAVTSPWHGANAHDKGGGSLDAQGPWPHFYSTRHRKPTPTHLSDHLATASSPFLKSLSLGYYFSYILPTGSNSHKGTFLLVGKLASPLGCFHGPSTPKADRHPCRPILCLCTYYGSSSTWGCMARLSDSPTRRKTTRRQTQPHFSVISSLTKGLDLWLLRTCSGEE